VLKIRNLKAAVNEVEILKGINLTVEAGQVHAIMGPNGSGKSTLSKVIAGHPNYHVTSGTVTFEVNFKPKNLLELSPEERAREGVFLGFQYPVEVPGLANSAFLRAAFNSVCKHHGVEEMDPLDFDVFLDQKMKMLNIDPSFKNRFLNTDLSGGEKKRNEILQMAVLNPRLALLDETDSGLDVDSLREVATGINQLKSKKNAVILVTHYQRLLDYITPDFVHVLLGGEIVESGDASLAKQIERSGHETWWKG